MRWTDLSQGLLAAIIVEANAKASDSGANNSVKGYLTFLLFSVAGLACQFCRAFYVTDSY